MATTRIIPLARRQGPHGRQGHQRHYRLCKKSRQKPTTAGSSPATSATAAWPTRSFLLDKQTYVARTGRVRGKDDVIAYHLRQSFVPGRDHAGGGQTDWAWSWPGRFTNGRHAFIVCTHIDKAHVPQPYYMELHHAGV